MSKKLFNEFKPVSAKAWKQKIQLDLKGADYNDTLIWHSPEGIDVKPFYSTEDLENTLPPINTNHSWKIYQTIYVENTSEANKKAIDVLNRGAESLHFIISNDTINPSELLNNIDLKNVSILFELAFLSKKYAASLNDIAKKEQANFYLLTDIIGHLAKSGNWYENLKEDHAILENIIANNTSLKSSLSINVSLYQNSGANITQQLAYALAHANEYLNHLGNSIKNNVVFNVAVGSNYFFEIAKLKALRLLWHTLALEYYANPSSCIINAVPTKRNKTIYDYNTNLLRTTTESMSASLGSVDFISNLRYDAIYHNDNEFGERIARNQLLVLKHESYFDAVNNPTEGAYYIETLTTQLADKALAIFKDIEKNGGFLKQLKEGIIQRKIKESASKEQELFDAEKIVLLGTNKHINKNDKMKNDLERFPFLKINKRKTLIEPIIPIRLSEAIEKERLDNEK
ncbi:methylmalonyl-CoA mutase subunit beta [Pontimicrobium aquaticum]|uniref:Methylmalonyl-CoA mutase n=1 Tax=Pontimicrobium aquaticum TaxID=2565367 RepID=A0A4U0EWA6_9FLAO|nr:methylmalonyl-CoA mutase subunit beta [Pontimicrobium aquaticum]TJY36251.1 methylmalonyl-CoA mutase [Pontimicrobium aquaticum]